jgi:CheY-like chemotaxis protein
VQHVPHGLAALAELATADYDLAVLDLDLPGIDGLQLARLLRARGETLPLLALTARADPQAEPEARAAGMDGFLRKPVTGELLAAAIAGLESAPSSPGKRGSLSPP